MATTLTELNVNDIDYHDRLIASSIALNGYAPSSKQTAKSVHSLPKVGDVDLATVASQQHATQAIIESMKVSGACIVRRMINKDALDEIGKDMRPHLETASVWEGDFYPIESRRVTGCIGKSKAFALNIIGHPIFHAVGRYFLTSQLKWNWIGAKNERSTSLPQLSNTVVFSIHPGARKQDWHRDDDTHHNQQAFSPVHHLGRDTGMTVFVAGSRSNRMNGATRFIPGSHLWDYSVPPPMEDDDSVNHDGGDVKVIHAELEPGDAFFMLSGVIHAAGTNSTEDEERLIYSAAMTRGWLRQEENQYLANDADMIKGLPTDLQRFAGWSLSRPSLGWVDFGDPIGLLGEAGEEGVEDMF